MKRVIVNKISKKFKIGFKKKQTAIARFSSFFSGREPKKTLIALQDVSFSADAGEIVGIIGKNGSGKSTLLRILAGIYTNHEGSKSIKGRMIPLIGLGQGLNRRLTMKDNIFLVGSLFGLSKRDIKNRFNSIVAFSDLKEYVHTKPYQFSEGMKQRLAFSIAIHCNPAVLLLDEVFEVGDEEFKKKSTGKIKELVNGGATVLLVSHDLDLIKKYCDKVIWLDEGRIKMIGKTKEIVKKYKKIFG